MDSSSDNNPGITGMISPFIKLDHGYFSDKGEPDTWEERYRDIYEEYKKAEGLREVFDSKGKLLNINDNAEELKSAEENVIAMKQAVMTALSAVDSEVIHLNEGELPNGL